MNLESQQSIAPDSIDREMRLKSYFDVVSSHFGIGDTSLTSLEKDILTKIEGNKGEISGRTALIAEIVLTDYVKSLTHRNEEIKSILNSSENFNRVNLEEEIRLNSEKIRVIRGNCLNTLGEINNSLS